MCKIQINNKLKEIRKLKNLINSSKILKQIKINRISIKNLINKLKIKVFKINILIRMKILIKKIMIKFKMS